MTISEKNREFIDKVLNTIDWDLILKFYKLVGRTIGSESTQIPGIKKISSSKLTSEDIKDEVSCIVAHVVENDKAEFFYGPWDITWVNGEWEIEIDPNSMGEESEEEPLFMPILELTLEISFSPMFVSGKEMVVENYEEETGRVSTKSDIKSDLEEELEKALSEENYELASKLRDVISIYKNKK